MACLSLLMTPLPYLFYRYGYVIRRKSRYAVFATDQPEPQSDTKPKNERTESSNETIAEEPEPNDRLDKDKELGS